MKQFLFLASIIYLISCTNSDTSENNKREIKSASTISFIKHLPNDKFREHLSILTGKDNLTFDTILTVLDQHHLFFCDYIKRLMQIDDSCAAIGNRKFPDPSQQKELNRFLDKAVESTEFKYTKSLGLTKHCLDWAGTFYAFDSTARRICGNFPSYESNY
jgi:hypothetical protein